MTVIHNDNPILLAGTFFLVMSVVPAFGVLWEITRVPWNRGPLRGLGRVLFSKSAIIAAILSFSLISASLLLFGWGRPTWFEVLRLVLFAMFTPVLYAQWFVYRRLRKTGSIPESIADHNYP